LEILKGRTKKNLKTFKRFAILRESCKVLIGGIWIPKWHKHTKSSGKHSPILVHKLDIEKGTDLGGST